MPDVRAGTPCSRRMNSMTATASDIRQLSMGPDASATSPRPSSCRATAGPRPPIGHGSQAETSSMRAWDSIRWIMDASVSWKTPSPHGSLGSHAPVGVDEVADRVGGTRSVPVEEPAPNGIGPHVCAQLVAPLKAVLRAPAVRVRETSAHGVAQSSVPLGEALAPDHQVHRGGDQSTLAVADPQQFRGQPGLRRLLPGSGAVE